MCEPKFYTCDRCREVIQVICGEKGDYACCGEPMKQLIPGATEGAGEKHVPVVEQNGREITVKVGEIYHPMSEEHSIGFVYLQTEKGGQRADLCPSDQPVAHFTVAHGDRPVAAYAWCNLHGFWKTEIKG